MLVCAVAPGHAEKRVALVIGNGAYRYADKLANPVNVARGIRDGGGVQANYHMGRGLGGMTGTDNKFYMEDLGGGFLDDFVTRGYAVATGSLNVMGTNNDDVKSAETVAKIKEHFIEEFGPPMFTIGHGASGGSMQQHLIGNNYPGLLDAIMPARSYPDAMSFLQPLYDCEMLEHVFDTSSNRWTTEQKGAVAGKYWATASATARGTRMPGPATATLQSRADWRTIRSSGPRACAAPTRTIW
jgi:hypothetical protein